MAVTNMYRKTILITSLSAALLNGCGSGNNQQQKVQETPTTSSSSQGTSSSSISNNGLAIKFIFPTLQANLGAVESTNIQLSASLINGKEITALDIEGIQLSEISEGLWLTVSEKLALVNSDDQNFTVYAQDEDGNSYQSEFTINNSLSGIAGIGDSLNANSLAFKDETQFFVTDAYEGALVLVNLNSSSREKIQEYTKPTDFSKPLYWPVKVDRTNEEVYVLSDYYAYNEQLGRETYNIEVNISDYLGDSSRVTELISNSEINRLTSVNSFVLDTDNQIPSHTAALEGKKSIYALDFEANALLKRVILETGRTLSLTVQQNADSQISVDNKPKSIIAYGADSFLVLRSQAGDSGLGTPSLVEINFQREDLDFDGVPESTTIVSTQFAVLESSSNIVQKPTAMALNHDQTTLYIADQDKIWAMDLTQESKPFELLTSSSIIPGKKGQGPRLGSSITSMELHPEHDVLYIAADAQGIMAVDLETGDRITVAK